MTVHLCHRTLPPPPPPTGAEQRATREALTTRLYYLNREIAGHEKAIADAWGDDSPLATREIAIRQQLLPGLRAERKAVRHQLDLLAHPEPPRVPKPKPAAPKVPGRGPGRPRKEAPPGYVAGQRTGAAQQNAEGVRDRMRRRLAEMGATR